jgi:hypothetical protein
VEARAGERDFALIEQAFQGERHSEPSLGRRR